MKTKNFFGKRIDQTSKIPNDNLSTSVSLKWHQTLGPWYIENRFTFPIRKWIVCNRLLYKIISKVNSIINSQFIQLKRCLERYELSYALLVDKKDIGYKLESKFGYTGDVFVRELTTAHEYKKQIDDGFVGLSESKILYDHIIKTSSVLMRSLDIRHHFNFGVSFAYTDSILASRFPKIRFYGIERTSAAKIYNEQFFNNITNLKLLYGDVFKILSKHRFDDGIFFHSRTLLLLPKQFIEKLYTAAYLAGFKYIFGTEQYGVSRQTGCNYTFTFEPRDSVVYRDFMYIHNYPNLLHTAGFYLQHIESIQTDHPQEDYRILSFIARSNIPQS